MSQQTLCNLRFTVGPIFAVCGLRLNARLKRAEKDISAHVGECLTSILCYVYLLRFLQEVLVEVLHVEMVISNRISV